MRASPLCATGSTSGAGSGSPRSSDSLTTRPQTCSNGTLPGELLDVDAPVAERGAFLVRLGDLRLEGDDALEPQVRGGAHLPILAEARLRRRRV